MKNNAIRMFLALGAACVFGSALEAQSIDLKAKVPFAFHVIGKDFAAGKYALYTNGPLGVPTIQNVTTRESVFVIGADHSLSAGGDPRLVFHCYAGNNCFLSEIRLGRTVGSRVGISKAEKEILKGEGPHEMATISVGLRQAD
jgi:hypothetical protein